MRKYLEIMGDIRSQTLEVEKHRCRLDILLSTFCQHHTAIELERCKEAADALSFASIKLGQLQEERYYQLENDPEWKFKE